MELCKATSAKTEVDIPEKFIQEALEPRIAEAQTGKHARFFVKSNKKATWLLIFCMILWGMGWPSGQKIVHNISFDALIFWRFFIAFLALLPFLLFLPKFKITKKELFFILLGTIAFATYIKLFFLGIAFGQAGIGGAIFTALSPLGVFLFSWAFFKTPISKHQFFALLLGILGISLILKLHLGLAKLFDSGNVYFVVAALVWSILTLISQKAANTLNMIVFNTLLSFFAALFFFFLAGTQQIMDAFEQDLHFWGYLVFISAITSSFATTTYFWAVGKIGARKAGSFIFIVPLSAIVSSYLLVGEAIYMTTLLGATLALSGVYLLQKHRL